MVTDHDPPQIRVVISLHRQLKDQDSVGSCIPCHCKFLLDPRDHFIELVGALETTAPPLSSDSYRSKNAFDDSAQTTCAQTNDLYAIVSTTRREVDHLPASTATALRLIRFGRG